MNHGLLGRMSMGLTMGAERRGCGLGRPNHQRPQRIWRGGTRISSPESRANNPVQNSLARMLPGSLARQRTTGD
eukprot:12922947-Prorocentrum_lima.AAC.1